jgi:tetratricopeptide (TPR) repeat protein
LDSRKFVLKTIFAEAALSQKDRSVHIFKILIPLLAISVITLFFVLKPKTWHRSPNNPQSGLLLSPVSAHIPSPAKAQETHEARMLTLALDKKPDHVPVLFRLAKLASEAGRPAEAAQYLKDILKQEPANLEARLEFGKISFELGNVQEAISQTEEILKEHPGQPDALYNLGAIYGNLGNNERALGYWKQLLSTSPTSESGMRARQLIAELK